MERSREGDLRQEHGSSTPILGPGVAPRQRAFRDTRGTVTISVPAGMRDGRSGVQEGMRDRGTSSALLLLLVAGALPASAAGGPFSTEGGPLDVGPRLRTAVERGLRESPTLGGVVDAIAAAPMTCLRVELRHAPSTAVRARSTLRVARGVTLRTGRGDERVDRVTGEILLPPDATDDDKLVLLAHELAHVVLRLREGARPEDGRNEEYLAQSVERAVAAELRSAAHRPVFRWPEPLPASLAPASAAADLRRVLGLDRPR